MSLTRQTQKVFGSNADTDQLAVFGTMKTGTPVYSTNLATLQSTAYTEGWSEAILDDKAPYMEEMNAVQYGLSYQIAYLLQEGIGAYDANTTYSDTSIVKVFESGKLYFYHSLIDNNVGHALDNPTYWEKINISDTRNIGELVTSLIPLTDAGLHLLDGSLLSGIGAYSQFVTHMAGLYTDNPTANYFCSEADWQTSVSTYGVCGKFVYDSVNNTVRLPKVTGFIEGTIDVSALGDLIEAGLPNITGNFVAANNSTYWGGNVTGAFTASSYNSHNIGNGGTTCYWNNISLDASRSSSVYDNSSTVQPQAIKGFIYIVVATSTKTNIQVDIDEIATDLNGKADVDLTNVNDSGTSTGAGWAMPSDTYKDLTLGASGTTYTAPANGYFHIGARQVSGTQSYFSIVGLDGAMIEQPAAWGGAYVGILYPTKKNDVVSVNYNGTYQDIIFRFYYAVGSESEAS